MVNVLFSIFVIIKAVKDTTNIGTIHHADIDGNSFDELTVKDPYFWPSKINDDFVDYCIKKGPSFFQNKQKLYTQSARISGKYST